MSLPDAVSQRVTSLLCRYAGTQIHIAGSEPITEGWSARLGLYPWVIRCTLEGNPDGVPGSVIVKLCRPAAHIRGGSERLHQEQAALEFLTSLGSGTAPRLLTADHAGGILVMEDLGTGPALEDLLLDSDSHPRRVRAGHACLRMLAEEPKTPTGRRWLALALMCSIL